MVLRIHLPDPRVRYHTVNRGKYKGPEAGTGLIIAKKGHGELRSWALFKKCNRK